MGKWIGLSLCLAVFGTATSALEACQDSVIHLRGDWGEARFAIDVVDTPEDRSQGLMFVESMPRMSGMFFVYENAQTVSFWMKNTLIPLDMIFAGADGVVRRVHANAIPQDETAIPGGTQIQYVLEINGGVAAQLGINEGSEMRHPAISADVASWPCE